MITVDIVSPLGGNVGGVENVIRKWTREIDPEQIELRVFHCYKGGAYLQGYTKQWSTNAVFEKADIHHLIDAYTLFIQGYGPPDICIATNWPIMVFACAYVRQQLGLSKMRIISWVHSAIAAYEKENLGGVTEMLNADAHFAISHSIAEEIRCKEKRTVIYEIGNPVDFPKSLDGFLENEVDEHMLTFAGRLSIEKGIDIILEAMQRTKTEWRLRIIGDGEIKENVNEWIRIFGLENRVELLGWQENPWQKCKDSRWLVMASQYEGFPMTAVEAAAHGKGIITTPIDGVTDYMIPGKTGYLFPFANAAKLAEILDGIDSGELQCCDPWACRQSVECYETDKYFGSVMQALMEVLAQPL